MSSSKIIDSNCLRWLLNVFCLNRTFPWSHANYDASSQDQMLLSFIKSKEKEKKMQIDLLVRFSILSIIIINKNLLYFYIQAFKRYRARQTYTVHNICRDTVMHQLCRYEKKKKNPQHFISCNPFLKLVFPVMIPSALQFTHTTTTAGPKYNKAQKCLYPPPHTPPHQIQKTGSENDKQEILPLHYYFQPSHKSTNELYIDEGKLL